MRVAGKDQRLEPQRDALLDSQSFKEIVLLVEIMA